MNTRPITLASRAILNALLGRIMGATDAELLQSTRLDVGVFRRMMYGLRHHGHVVRTAQGHAITAKGVASLQYKPAPRKPKNLRTPGRPLTARTLAILRALAVRPTSASALARSLGDDGTMRAAISRLRIAGRIVGTGLGVWTITDYGRRAIARADGDYVSEESEMDCLDSIINNGCVTAEDVIDDTGREYAMVIEDIVAMEGRGLLQSALVGGDVHYTPTAKGRDEWSEYTLRIARVRSGAETMEQARKVGRFLGAK